MFTGIRSGCLGGWLFVRAFYRGKISIQSAHRRVQNHVAVRARVQVPLDLTCHRRRESSF